VKKTIFVYPLVVLALGIGLCACAHKTAAESPAEKAGDASPSVVTLTPEAVKMADVQTEPAAFRPATRTIHVPGEVIFNPKRLVHVTARTAGRIERLAAYPGDRVTRGDVLLSLYSQEFLTAQAEFLQAVQRLKRFAEDPTERVAARSLYESAKSRLRILDLTDTELAEIESSGSILTLLPVRAPFDGTIIESAVTLGDSILVGASLFRIADLSTVWADMQAYEKDLPAVHIGSEITLAVSDLPGREFKGRLFQVGNTVDEKTRTVEVRVELANGDGHLRPGMFVEADIIAPLRDNVLMIPGAAIQEFQNKKVVFVRVKDSTYTVRDVVIGATFEGYVEILKGLSEKETVATTGSFFLKSELLKKTLGED
jgi:membrane fusion protein, copper/silver efflux system